MPKRCKLQPFLMWIYFLTVNIADAVVITLQHPYDGFFLRDSYDKKKDSNDHNTISQSFIVNQPSNLYKVRAQYGPYESHHMLSKELLEIAYARSRKNNSLVHRSVVFNMDISVHIVSKDISPKVPRLQVLVHASPFSKSASSHTQHWCAQVFAEANGAELSSVCIVTEKNNVCVASLDLPKEWWTSENYTRVKVSYAFIGIDRNDQCASASNSIIPVRSIQNNSEIGITKQEITLIQLIRNLESFDEWKDQDILIDVPKEMFHQSDLLEIPIRLEKNSDLQTFVMRARVRQGLRITGARMTDPSSQWSIQVDIKDHQKSGTITAFVKDMKMYKKSANVQDVFRWQLEVAEDTYDTRDLGRVVWGIEYIHNSMASEWYPSEESKIVSQINIRSKDQLRLVPVLKVNEIVNVAVLSGGEQVYPLRIYAVDDSNRLTDVTVQTKCHSVEVDVLKVAKDCATVYVDGTESRGSYNVSIIAKHGQTTAFLDVTVWVPEERLDLHLSDTLLSQVKTWRVPSVRTRTIDPNNKHVKIPEEQMCELQWQQSVVEVFARFYIQTPKQTDYFMGAGTYLKVTDLVKSRLRISDTRIATLHENIVKVKEDGRTEIQLLSPRNGHIVAAREIQVSHNKVILKRLNLKLVTGITLYITPSIQVDGALVTTAIINGQFLGQHREGIIDVELVYSDMTTLPLKYIEPEDYVLDVVAKDDNKVGIAQSDSPPHQPHIVAKGEGMGEVLEVILRLGKSCTRKKSKPLANNTLAINIDFSVEHKVADDNKFQMDAHYDTNRASDRWEEPNRQWPMVYTIKPQSEDEKDFKESKFAVKNKIKDSNKMKVIAIKDDFEDLLEKKVDVVNQEPLALKTLQEGLTPLEIGMYVLLAVFCVAMSVFMVNCFVFFLRYKFKQKPRKLSSKEVIKDASDWVWIGRATLERNSLYTHSSRTLMPQEDFNGNINLQRPPSVRSSCSTSSHSSSSGVTNPYSQNSNRNSVVSTYKGSECSIRITTNPFVEDGGAMAGLPEESQSETVEAQWDYEAMGMTYDQLLDYFANLKESDA